LSEQEILALAISSEETDARIYADFAAGLKTDYPATTQIFKEIEAEEDEHRRELIEEYRHRFGEHIPLIRREDVKGIRNRYMDTPPRGISSDCQRSVGVPGRNLDRQLLIAARSANAAANSGAAAFRGIGFKPMISEANN
jgi:hypothetical protein